LDRLEVELRGARELLEEWQEERDGIALETEEFRGEDMNRLRKVCIGESSGLATKLNRA